MNIIEKIDVGLQSRKLFKNWISILFSYLLNNNTLYAILKSGKELEISREMFSYLMYKSYNGEVLSIDYDNKNSLLILNNEIIIDLTTISKHKTKNLTAIIKAYKNGWRYANGYYEKNGVKFRYLTSAVFETFENKIYDEEVKEKEIVDVGANIGDTAIYYAINGARKIIALEPLPSIYTKAKINITLNNLEDKIIFLNAALGDNRGKIHVPEEISIEDSTIFSSLKPKGNYEVDVITLKDVLKLLKKPYLLKMDCEGCEASVILNNYEDILNFHEIIMEYHSYITKIPVITLKKKLSRDYNCEMINCSVMNDINKVGMMKCIKLS